MQANEVSVMIRKEHPIIQRTRQQYSRRFTAQIHVKLMQTVLDLWMEHAEEPLTWYNSQTLLHN